MRKPPLFPCVKAAIEAMSVGTIINHSQKVNTPVNRNTKYIATASRYALRVAVVCLFIVGVFIHFALQHLYEPLRGTAGAHRRLIEES